MHSKLNVCVDHPLGILCKCAEYQEIRDKFMFYAIGTENYVLPKMNVEPFASAKVTWGRNRLNFHENFTKPILLYPEEKIDINASNVDEMWIPVLSDLIPLKYVINKHKNVFGK
ncbi:hypothetical protein ANTQUA_LOCUS5268 [Anthophora quadrimaculata]